MPKKYDHPIHKYERVKLGSKDYIVYKCMLPNCTHFIQIDLAVGRLSLCWGGCGGAVMITKEMIGKNADSPNGRGLKWPVCDSCKEKMGRGNFEKKEVEENTDEFLAGILKGKF